MVSLVVDSLRLPKAGLGVGTVPILSVVTLLDIVVEQDESADKRDKANQEPPTALANIVQASDRYREGGHKEEDGNKEIKCGNGQTGVDHSYLSTYIRYIDRKKK